MPLELQPAHGAFRLWSPLSIPWSMLHYPFEVEATLCLRSPLLAVCPVLATVLVQPTPGSAHSLVGSEPHANAQ